MKAKKIALVVGTRPDIIKMSPIIRYLEQKKADYFVVHTGQHYSYELDKVFFEELQLPEPKYSLGIKSIGPHRQGYHTGMMLLEMEKIFLEELPGIVLVHGDTNSALAGALLASKITTTREYTGYYMLVGHVEAGLRSYDRSMPEEINRVLCDHLANFLFAPTETARQNMLKEGIEDKNIFVVGNTIVDAVQQNLEIARKKKNVLRNAGMQPKKYVLVTVHRQENVDNREKFRNILDGLVLLRKKFGMNVLYPIHPRAKKMMEQFGFVRPQEITFIEPVGFLEFLQLEANAKLVVTDSGGVQEESCILNIPCVTVRENTERPETVEMKANVLAGTDPKRILEGAKSVMDTEGKFANPFGDGTSAKRIADILLNGRK